MKRQFHFLPCFEVHEKEDFLSKMILNRKQFVRISSQLEVEQIYLRKCFSYYEKRIKQEWQKLLWNTAQQETHSYN